MTDEQIKKIAEEYAHSVMDIHIDNPLVSKKDWQDQFEELSDVTEQILEAITERYCVVERSKVVEEYELSKGNIDENNPLCIVSVANRGASIVLEKLFGSETFNKKE